MVPTVGLDRLRAGSFEGLRGKRIGLVSNQGAVGADYRYAVDIFRQAHIDGALQLKRIFGPQHGLFGHTQDNMIEWEGGNVDVHTGAQILSLYGEHRQPTPEMLDGLDALVVDLCDIGARYYTFIWTTWLCMEACAQAGVELVVLDRPNPIGGVAVQGTVLDPKYASFVGLKPLPMRHGKTLGELASGFRERYANDSRLTVIEAIDWDRRTYADEAGVPWSMPSPNMPTVDAAVVYPGMCLLEGTNISEGRGTTKPFETFGAPFLDGWKLADDLNSRGLDGVYFRPVEFLPTFQKHAGDLCGGCFIHVTDRAKFDCCLATVAILQACWEQSNGKMAWNPPPYEYEYTLLPIDILAGQEWFRPAIESRAPLGQVRDRMEEERRTFEAS